MIVAQPAIPVDDRLDAIARAIAETQNQGAIRVGELLHEARELFRYKRDEGGFAGWVDQRLCISRPTAYNLISVFERFGRGENVSNSLDTLPASVLYAIAAPKTPEAVRQEVIERAERGENVTTWDVKELKQAAEEASLPPRKQAKLKASREAERLASEKQQAEIDRRDKERREANAAAVALIVDRLGPDLSMLQDLLSKVHPDDFLNALLKASLKQAEAA